MESVHEEWRPVAGEFDGWSYSVSSQGRVASRKYGKFRLRKLNLLHHGYLQVGMRHGGREKKHLVHRLVAAAFVPGWADGLQVNHINGEKTDNRACNLEWVTPKRNMAHALEIGLVDRIGGGHLQRKLTMRDAEVIRGAMNRGVTQAFLARWFGISYQSIYCIRHGFTYKN